MRHGMHAAEARESAGSRAHQMASRCADGRWPSCIVWEGFCFKRIDSPNGVEHDRDRREHRHAEQDEQHLTRQGPKDEGRHGARVRTAVAANEY